MQHIFLYECGIMACIYDHHPASHHVNTKFILPYFLCMPIVRSPMRTEDDLKAIEYHSLENFHTYIYHNKDIKQNAELNEALKMVNFYDIGCLRHSKYSALFFH